MTIPTPPVPLKNQCSIIYNDILYTYQVNAFQSLSLKDGGTWTQLPIGVPTNGSACIQGAVNGQDSFIVLGGSTSAQNYQGMQYYSFGNNTWHSETPLTPVAENRLGHGAVYLNQSSSILMYAGFQDDSYSPSSQTFVIQTAPPYNIQAFESDATPVMNPLMIPWNTTHALMLGGDPTNTKLFTFGPQEGWQQLNVSLPSPLKDSSKVQATLMDGSDGSKILEIFDMSVSPNQLSTLLVQNATNTPTSKRSSSYLRFRNHPSRRRKRDTTLQDRPAYNSTGAPQDTRVGFSLAQDPVTGLVLAVGGNDQAPLAIFNETGNQWVDPNQFFGNKPSPNGNPSSSSPPHTTSTNSPAASTSAAAAASDNAVRNKSLTILGAVLGGVFGIAILLILVLVLLRQCRRRRERKRGRQESSYALDDKAEMDFADVGADYMKESAAYEEPSNHRRKASDKSDASVKVRTMDRSGAASSQSKRALLHAKGDSTGSGKSFWSRGTKSPEKSPPFISAPIMGANPPLMVASPARGVGSPDPRTEQRADTGWSTYFTNNNTDSTQQSSGQEGRPNTYLSNSQSQSDYTTSTNPHASAEVEPLSFRESQNPSIYPANTRLMAPTGFPRPGLGLALTQGASPTREIGPPSPATLVSDMEEDEYAHHSHSDGQDSWSPVAAGSERESQATDPRVSSVYSANYPHPGERVRIPNFPTVPSSQRPSANNSLVGLPTSTANDSNRGLRNVASKDFVRTPSGRERAVPPAGTGRLPDYGASQVRTFPRRKEDLGARGRGSSQTEDMSWLNLGTSAEQSNNHLRY